MQPFPALSCNFWVFYMAWVSAQVVCGYKHLVTENTSLPSKMTVKFPTLPYQGREDRGAKTYHQQLHTCTDACTHAHTDACKHTCTVTPKCHEGVWDSGVGEPQHRQQGPECGDTALEANVKAGLPGGTAASRDCVAVGVTAQGSPHGPGLVSWAPHPSPPRSHSKRRTLTWRSPMRTPRLTGLQGRSPRQGEGSGEPDPLRRAEPKISTHRAAPRKGAEDTFKPRDTHKGIPGWNRRHNTMQVFSYRRCAFDNLRVAFFFFFLNKG